MTAEENFEKKTGLLNDITVRKARVHNLDELSVSIPKNTLTVVCGVSGSGKSSLAFDTIFAEGQRRYIESLSSYARQFLGQLEKADADSIEGLSPAVSIDQKSTSRNPRSTVGTITEIWDYMRLLYARLGEPYCWEHKEKLQAANPAEIRKLLIDKHENRRAIITAPLVQGRKGTHQDLLRNLQEEGFGRVRVNGEIFALEEVEPLDKNKNHSIDLIIDRIVIKKEDSNRTTNSVETAFEAGKGVIHIEVETGRKGQGTYETLKFSQNLACPVCLYSINELEPRMFSFNSPYGACTSCNGLGYHMRISEELLLSVKNLSINQGALLPWFESSAWDHFSMGIEQVFEQHHKNGKLEKKYSLDTPFKDLPKWLQGEILHGNEMETVAFFNKRRYTRTYEGVAQWVRRRHANATGGAEQKLERYFLAGTCETCKGQRLQTAALNVYIQGKTITEVADLDIEKLYDFFQNLKFDENSEQIARGILRELRARSSFLLQVGLGYLTLNRAANTLSGGEAQRIRLATQVGAGLSGVIYVLDEPSIGLHQKDNAALIQSLKDLRDLGNTLLVVEHDEETLKEADHIVEIGPGAGEHGGKLVFEGTFQELLKEKRSITGAYVSGRKTMPEKKKPRKRNAGNITLYNAKGNNLKVKQVSFPLKVFTTVTGVSGSGKSTLVNDTLGKTLMRELNGTVVQSAQVGKVTGIEEVDKLVLIDQSPIGRTPRSNPATYTGLFTLIRNLFAQTTQAKTRGYLPGRFSFNVHGGRCETCKGDGTLRVEMNFLPDVYVQCENCKGQRFNEATLQVKYKNRNISDVLNMSVEEALSFFKAHNGLRRHLQTLHDVGLGYVRLGQSATTLSGGEAQRVKLASELLKRATGKTVYILDEPTVGLHSDDVAKLLTVLDRLVDSGNTVIVIEHNLDVVAFSDYIIDLGPEGGPKGGEIVGKGTVQKIAELETHTGKYLSQHLKRFETNLETQNKTA